MSFRLPKQIQGYLCTLEIALPSPGCWESPWERLCVWTLLKRNLYCSKSCKHQKWCLASFFSTNKYSNFGRCLASRISSHSLLWLLFPMYLLLSWYQAAQDSDSYHMANVWKCWFASESPGSLSASSHLFLFLHTLVFFSFLFCLWFLFVYFLPQIWYLFKPLEITNLVEKNNLTKSIIRVFPCQLSWINSWSQCHIHCKRVKWEDWEQRQKDRENKGQQPFLWTQLFTKLPHCISFLLLP